MTLQLITCEKLQYQSCTNPHLYSKAWEECIELQVMDKQAWCQHYTGILESVNRWEIGLWDTHNHFAVGGLVLAHDSDIHVGRCMSVISQYVLPDYRNRSISLLCMLEAIHIAKANGYSVLAYTHRLGDWRYETIYKRITDGQTS